MVMMNEVRTWACPACGREVPLSEGLPAPDGREQKVRMDRLAHAVCGCYILDMPDGDLTRLLAALLLDPLDEEAGSSAPRSPRGRGSE
jgi:hypothetical protein